VQYHPEHTFATTTAIIEASQDRLVAEGADARTGAVVGFSRFRAGRDRGYAGKRSRLCRNVASRRSRLPISRTGSRSMTALLMMQSLVDNPEVGGRLWGLCVFAGPGGGSGIRIPLIFLRNLHISRVYPRPYPRSEKLVRRSVDSRHASTRDPLISVAYIGPARVRGGLWRPLQLVCTSGSRRRSAELR
jgi:hypothetical protein